LVFAGAGGALERPLEKYVSRHGLSERVRIMGQVNLSQWSMLFQQATIVVMPSLWNEPLGLAGIYAMAHGKPVIAFRNSGIEEWLENEVTGIAVPFGNRGQFIKETVRILKDRKRLQVLGNSARERWEQKFQPSHHLARLREFYAGLGAKA
jgi:glycosyltransferase involved in cell wall biosynthesis